MSGRTWERAKTVVQAAHEEPEKYGGLAEEMDRAGKVNGVFRKLTIKRKAEAIRREEPSLPPGKYHVIVADPPWTFHKRAQDASHRGTTPYPSMSLDEIRKLDVPQLSLEDSSLWLWTTNSHLRQAFEIMEAWGFQYKTLLTWGKHKIGLGDWLRGKTEHCLVGTKGSPTFVLKAQSTLLLADSGRHSAKPDEFYALVESLCPGRKAELFQRRPRNGWIGHGDEVRK